MRAKVADLLNHKGHQVVTATPETSIADAARMLTIHRIGAVPVLAADGSLAGIVSERDIVRGLVESGVAIMTAPVARLMTREVRTCRPGDEIVALMETMTNQRIRHLPVVQGGELLGIVSIGDVVKQRLAEAHFELEELHRFIASN